MYSSSPITEPSLKRISMLGVSIIFSVCALLKATSITEEFVGNSSTTCFDIALFAFSTSGLYLLILKCFTELDMSLATLRAIISSHTRLREVFRVLKLVLLERECNSSRHQSRIECAVTEKLKKWSIRLLSSISNRRRLPSRSSLINKSFGRSSPVIFDINMLSQDLRIELL